MNGQRHQVFDSFVTTVGTNGTISFPLRDAGTAHIPTLRVGPQYRRNAVRFFAKMPTKEEASRLPAPLKCDRSSVTFEPVMLYIGGPLPPHCTAMFTRVLAGKNRGKMSKKPIHQWAPQTDSLIYPAATIQLPALRPEEAIEFEGVSWWYNARPPRAGQRQRLNPFAYPLPPEPPPDIDSLHPVQLMLLVRMKFLPRTVGKKKFRVVQGSPVDWNAQPTSINPESPAPEVFHPAEDT